LVWSKRFGQLVAVIRAYGNRQAIWLEPLAAIGYCLTKSAVGMQLLYTPALQ